MLGVVNARRVPGVVNARRVLGVVSARRVPGVVSARRVLGVVNASRALGVVNASRALGVVVECQVPAQCDTSLSAFESQALSLCLSLLSACSSVLLAMASSAARTGRPAALLSGQKSETTTCRRIQEDLIAVATTRPHFTEARVPSTPAFDPLRERLRLRGIEAVAVACEGKTPADGCELWAHLWYHSRPIVQVLRTYQPLRHAAGRLAAVNNAWRAHVRRLGRDVESQIESYISSYRLVQAVLALPTEGLRTLYQKRVIPFPEDDYETTLVGAMLRPAALALGKRAFMREARRHARLLARSGYVEEDQELRHLGERFQEWKAEGDTARKEAAKARKEAAKARKEAANARREAAALPTPHLNAAYCRLPLLDRPGVCHASPSIRGEDAFLYALRSLEFDLAEGDVVVPHWMLAVARNPAKAAKLLESQSLLSYRVYFGSSQEGVVVEVVWGSERSPPFHRRCERLNVFLRSED